MPSKKASKTTKSQLITDIQHVALSNGDNVVTRNFYREHGKYPESAWQKFFPKFDDFCTAAGVNCPSAISEIQGKAWTLFLPKTSSCSLEDIIEQYEIDTRVWELDRFRAKDITKDGEVAYQITAAFKKRKDMVAIYDEIQQLKNLAKSEARTPESIERPAELTGNMLEMNIPDIHFGKQAWPVETGHEPYDTKIAYTMFMRALNTLLERTSHFKFDSILFVVGNDVFNSDNIEGTTTKGTMVTTDGRYHKTFYKVRRAMVEAIEKMRLIAPVKVMVIPGNHDQLAAWHLGDSLECYFHNYTDVIIGNQPTTRKYVEFGKCMIGFTHGDKGKRDDYPLLMATEQPEMFGRTKFREMHCGHTHETKTTELHGVRVRVLPALCPPDDWHAEQGYTGNLRNAEAYVWNAKEGLINITIYNDDSQEGLVTHRSF